MVQTQVQFYFQRVRDLELGDMIYFIPEKARLQYRKEIKTTYEILYDRIMTSKVSTLLKREIEEWYSFNREFIGFSPTEDINQELEDILRRFYAI
jgi:hypothetical protein